jgi:hypothetical protein
MNLKIISIGICFLMTVSVFNAQISVGTIVTASDIAIPLPGSVSDSVGSGDDWKGFINVPAHTYNLKIEIKYPEDIAEWQISPKLTDPDGNTHGSADLGHWAGDQTHYSGPSNPQYFFFENPKQGKWNLLLRNDDSHPVSFTITTSARTGSTRFGYEEMIKRVYYDLSGAFYSPSFVDYSQVDGYVFDYGDTKKFRVTFGETEILNSLKGYGSINIAVPKGKAILQHDQSETWFWNLGFGAVDSDTEVLLEKYTEFIKLIAGNYDAYKFNLIRSIYDKITEIIFYLRADIYEYGEGPENSVWTNEDDYDIYCFAYNTGEIWGFSTNRQQTTIPIKFTTDEDVTIYVHTTYSWWNGYYETKKVGDDNSIIYNKKTHHPPETPTITGPDEGAKDVPCGPFTACSYEPDGDPVKYQWDWNNDEVMDEETDNWLDNGNCESRSYTWGAIGKKYFRVRCRDGCGDFSEWSDPYEVIIKSGDPSVPTNPVPIDGATGVRYSLVTLCWDDCSDPNVGDYVWYEVFFGESSNNLKRKHLEGTYVTESAFFVGDLDPSKTYYWKINSVDWHYDDNENKVPSGGRSEGPTWHFTTESTCCFPAGTMISMADGGSKPIEDIKLGDRVLSYDFEACSFDSWTVKMLGRPVHPVCSINDGLLSCTVDHPLHIKKTDNTCGIGAVDAVRSKSAILFDDIVLSLDIGDRLLTKDKEWIKVESITIGSEEVQTYNILSFSGDKNYFANGVLVYEEHPSTAFTSVFLDNILEKFPRLSQFLFSKPWIINMFTP